MADSSGKVFSCSKLKLSVTCIVVGIASALSLSEHNGYKKSHEMLETTIVNIAKYILILLLLG